MKIKTFVLLFLTACTLVVLVRYLAPFLIFGAIVWWLLYRRKGTKTQRELDKQLKEQATALDEIHGARLRGDEILREHGINPETGRPYTTAEREIEANPAKDLDY